eukprot:5429964-Pleurochrysis_carterae.AAC.2
MHPAVRLCVRALVCACVRAAARLCACVRASSIAHLPQPDAVASQREREVRPGRRVPVQKDAPAEDTLGKLEKKKGSDEQNAIMLSGVLHEFKTDSCYLIGPYLRAPFAFPFACAQAPLNQAASRTECGVTRCGQLLILALSRGQPPRSSRYK